MNITELLSSKKFKVAVIAVIAPIIAFYMKIPQETVELVVYALMATIFGYSIQDVGRSLADSKVILPAMKGFLEIAVSSNKLDQQTADDLLKSLSSVLAKNTTQPTK